MTSLAVLAERALERLGDGVALVHQGREHAAAELAARAARLATGLRGLAVGPGDRVVLTMTNRPEVQVVMEACWRAGAVVTPVMPTLTEAELRHVLTDSGAVVAVASDDVLPRVRAAAAGLPVQLVVVGDADGATSLAELETAEPGGLVDRDGRDTAALLYTGGTTGRSKGVALGHDNLWLNTLARQQVTGPVDAARLLVPLPLSHVFGLTNLVARWHLDRREPLVLQRRFDASEWLRLVPERRVQSAALVPSMLQLLLREPLEEHDLTSLRYVTCGGAPLAVAVQEQFQARVPSARVCDGYGCTEACSTATMTPYDAPRPGTVGRAVPGVQLRIVGADGAALPTGDDGEVLLRGPGVMLGYWQDPAATAQVLRDGWLHTGDVGHLDADGYLTVVDRLKDLVIRGGFNVYPRDVEEVLLAHPAVAAAAVVGRPDQTYGEEVVAYVALRPGAQTDEAALLAYAAARLAAHKRPRELHLVDAVPLTSVGKTDRKALRARTGH